MGCLLKYYVRRFLPSGGLARTQFRRKGWKAVNSGRARPFFLPFCVQCVVRLASLPPPLFLFPCPFFLSPFAPCPFPLPHSLPLFFLFQGFIIQWSVFVTSKHFERPSCYGRLRPLLCSNRIIYISMRTVGILFFSVVARARHSKAWDVVNNEYSSEE